MKTITVALATFIPSAIVAGFIVAIGGKMTDAQAFGIFLTAWVLITASVNDNR